MKLNRYIYNSIKKRFQNLDIIEESVKAGHSYIKRSEIIFENKKIKGVPVSTGYIGKGIIEGRVYSIENLTPSVIFQENLKGKIIYIKNVEKPEKLRYLLPLKPEAVIINREFKRPLFIEEFPVIYIPSLIRDGEIKIQLNTKKTEESVKNIYFDIGYGAYFLFLVFPYDSRYQTKDSIDFYGSFQVTKEIIRRLLEVKKPSGYRIRVLFSDHKYTGYRPLKEHIKKIDSDLILSIINTENSGLGNEKLIIKTDRNIIDSFHFERIKHLLGKLNLPLKTDRLEAFYFPDFKVPVVWFSSQPNNNIYTLKKEFLNRELIDRFASNLFYIMNNLYKEIG
ncbi:MAG TPA: hypothetical protein DEP48_00170 [Persephonella sp.]|uniref:Uncharacterized protein n=1 Tax=Persephonella marina (strain DSM 14350 / EX-H1) TaxID=123214 RepID=C0QQQ5_PERMH|nr:MULTISPECIES: hypothetical protein [Persephonella]ACO04010.1 hypothetical protein PERMA_1228 [Persephonella marina EX-H1]HCB68752.1 hypothetical protein [Persephonella sp.]